MLALKNRHGDVSGSVPGLAALANVSIPDCESALQKLISPDPYSRTKEFDGRRIEPIDGGWRILNARKYRDAMSEDERRAYKAKWIRDKRASVDKPVDSSMSTSTHADADADADSTEIAFRGNGVQKALALSDRMQNAKDVLGPEELKSRHRRWLMRAEGEPDKFDRVIAEVSVLKKEGRVTKSPGAAAEDLWKRFK